MQVEGVIKLPDNPYGSSKNGCSACGRHCDLTRARSHYKIRGQGRRGKWLRSHKDHKCDGSLELLQQVNPSSQEPEPVIIPVHWLTEVQTALQLSELVAFVNRKNLIKNLEGFQAKDGWLKLQDSYLCSLCYLV